MIDLEQLGFTKEQIQQRVIDQLCEQLLNGTEYDEDGNEPSTVSQFYREIDKRIKAQVQESIDKIAQAHVLPNVAQYVENLTLQETTAWGEKKGKPVTFIEYLVQRAEDYLREKVNYDGKAKDQDSYSWSGTQTRITYLVNSHLAHSIETAMKDALKIATGEVAKGIHETARLKLNEIAAQLKVSVTTR